VIEDPTLTPEQFDKVLDKVAADSWIDLDPVVRIWFKIRLIDAGIIDTPEWAKERERRRREISNMGFGRML
jgi:hypothetical protein